SLRPPRSTTLPYTTLFRSGHRLAPVALHDQNIDHLLEIGTMRQQFAPQGHRILAGSVRHFVDEAFHEENVLAVAGRAPRTKRHRSEEHTSELQSLRHLVCR